MVEPCVQQAAEKAIKAALVRRRVRFPYLHDLETLLTALSDAGEILPESTWNVKKLTPFAVEAHYPSVAREVTEEQYAEAVEIAEMVVHWAESIILLGNPGPDVAPK